MAINENTSPNLGRSGYAGGGQSPMLYDKIQKDKQRAHEQAMQSQALKAKSAESAKDRQFTAQRDQFQAQENRFQQAQQLRDRAEDRRLQERMREQDRQFQTAFQEREWKRRDQSYERYRQDMATERKELMEWEERRRRVDYAYEVQEMLMLNEIINKTREDPVKRAQFEQSRDQLLEKNESTRKLREMQRQKVQLEIGMAEGGPYDLDRVVRMQDGLDKIIQESTDRQLNKQAFKHMDYGQLEQMVIDGKLNRENLVNIQLAIEESRKALLEQHGNVTDEKARQAITDMIHDLDREYDMVMRLRVSDNPQVQQISKDAWDSTVSAEKLTSMLLKMDKEFQMSQQPRQLTAEDLMDIAFRGNDAAKEVYEEMIQNGGSLPLEDLDGGGLDMAEQGGVQSAEDAKAQQKAMRQKQWSQKQSRLKAAEAFKHKRRVDELARLGNRR